MTASRDVETLYYFRNFAMVTTTDAPEPYMEAAI